MSAELILGSIDRKMDLVRNNYSCCDNPATSIDGREDGEKSKRKEKEKEAQMTFQLSQPYRAI